MISIILRLVAYSTLQKNDNNYKMKISMLSIYSNEIQVQYTFYLRTFIISSYTKKVSAAEGATFNEFGMTPRKKPRTPSDLCIVGVLVLVVDL